MRKAVAHQLHTKEDVQAKIVELEHELQHKLATTQNTYEAGVKFSSHTRLKMSYAAQLNALRRKFDTVPYKCDADAAWQAQPQHIRDRIAELEQLRDAELQSTEYVQIGKRVSSHSIIKAKYNTKIGNLLKYGVECSLHAPEILKKTQQTNLARYGHVNGDVEKMCKTKIAKYGNIFCSKAKYEATCTERYGVPYFCMHAKCKSAQGRVCSKLNETWRNKIFELTGYLFEYERNDIGHWSYDLHLGNVLIEISPTVSHNSTYSFAYYIGRTKRNVPYDKLHHYRKMKAAVDAGCVLIMIWDWSNTDDIIRLINNAMSGKFVNDQHVDAVQLHWHNRLTGEHQLDCGQDAQQMIDAGFVAVYDCGDINQ